MSGETPPFVWGWVLGDTLTPEQAGQVRAWRVEDKYAFRRVAYEAGEAWGLDCGGSQIAGRALCWIAATVFGEDPDEEPWT